MRPPGRALFGEGRRALGGLFRGEELGDERLCVPEGLVHGKARNRAHQLLRGADRLGSTQSDGVDLILRGALQIAGRHDAVQQSVGERLRRLESLAGEEETHALVHAELRAPR